MVNVFVLRWRISFGLPHGRDEQVAWQVAPVEQVAGVGPGRRGGRGEGARGQQQEAGDAYHDGVQAGATERLVFLRYVARIYAGEPVLSDYTVLQIKLEGFI